MTIYDSRRKIVLHTLTLFILANMALLMLLVPLWFRQWVTLDFILYIAKVLLITLVMMLLYLPFRSGHFVRLVGNRLQYGSRKGSIVCEGIVGQEITVTTKQYLFTRAIILICGDHRVMLYASSFGDEEFSALAMMLGVPRS
jgi:hypothetical protein